MIFRVISVISTSLCKSFAALYLPFSGDWNSGIIFSWKLWDKTLRFLLMEFKSSMGSANCLVRSDHSQKAFVKVKSMLWGPWISKPNVYVILPIFDSLLIDPSKDKMDNIQRIKSVGFILWGACMSVYLSSIPWLRYLSSEPSGRWSQPVRLISKG